MALYQVAYNPTSRVALVQADNAAVPGGSVDVGSFEHPDPIYPGSEVVFHNVRDLLYKRSAANPTQMAMFPNNITDMQNVIIDLADDITSDDLIVLTHIAFQHKHKTIEQGQTASLLLDFSPMSGSLKQVKFESSDEAVAKVNKDGVLVSVAPGQATIIASVIDNDTLTDEMTVTVI